MYKRQVLDFAIIGNLDGVIDGLLRLMIFIVLTILLSYIYARTRIFIIQKSVYSLRNKFFKSLFNRKYSEYLEISEGEIIAKYSKQISNIEISYFTMMTIFTEMILEVVFVLFTLFYLNKTLAVLSAFILSLPIFVPKLFKARVTIASNDKLKTVQKHIEDVTGWFSGFEVIKNYRIEDRIIKMYDNSNAEVKRSEKKYEKENATTIGVSFAVSLGAQAIVVIIAAGIVLKGALTPGEFVTITGLVAVLRRPLYWISSFYQMIISTRPVRKSLFDFIDYPLDSKMEKQKGIVLEHESPVKVEFDGISYGYNDERLIDDFSLSIKPNNRCLIMGPSGCGKSTLMNLLMAYDNPREGTIRINDTDIRQILNLSDYITIARQEAVIFEDTVRNNLTMYNEKISDEKLIEVLNDVGLDKLANSKSLDYMLKESGSNLSGGEKKRLSLARALLRDSKILILDEPLANIDQENVEKIEDIILNIQNKTVIIISHQFSEEKKSLFDKLIYMDKVIRYEEAFE